MKTKGVCKGNLAETCSRYQLTAALDSNRPGNYQHAFRNTIKAEKEARALWALQCLVDPKKLPFQDRLILLQRLGSSWEALPAELQIHLQSILVERTKATLSSIRVSAPGIAPLHADQESIERRMRLLQEVDQSFSKITKLGWIEIKKTGIDELATIFERVITDLRGIHAPEELLTPFKQKQTDLKDASKKLEAMAFHFKPVSGNPLLSAQVSELIPERLRNEWNRAVQNRERDFLLFLAGDLGANATVVKGLILADSGAPSEAWALIETAPESPLKQSAILNFVRRKP